MPNAPGKAAYAACYVLLSVVEGIILVATPALIRDFSPQVGRGAAMAFWTMGPVLGSLVLTEVSSHTLAGHPDWRYQFRLCGVVGLAVWAIALIGLRELSPRLRDQLMVSLRDRALVEARAAGIDPEAALQGHWRQMLRPGIAGSAVAISLFLMSYFLFTAFVVVFLATVFGYPAAAANALTNWYWIAAALTMPVLGFASDRLGVRKPFMIAGAVISMTGVALLAAATTHPHTGYHTFAVYFVLMAAGFGLTFPAWMAGFTETVEKRNPAATATGLAIFGWTVRLAVVASFLLLTVVCRPPSTLVDKGTRVATIAATYPGQIQVLQTVDPATLATLKTDPGSRAAGAKAVQRDRYQVRDPAGAGGREAEVGLGSPARGPCLPVGQRGYGRPGRPGQPAPVAGLVVDLLRRPARVHPVRVRDGGPLESPQSARGGAAARTHGRPRAGAAPRHPRRPANPGQAVVTAHGYPITDTT